MKCLLVTSFFPPLVGGAPEVYRQLCTHLAPDVAVLAPSTDPATGAPLPGLAGHDAALGFPVRRIREIRPAAPRAPANAAASLGRLLGRDVPARLRVARAVARELRRGDPTCVCLGQLWALDWLGLGLALASRRRLICFVHGEEITAPTRGRVYGRFGFRALRAADAVVAVSRFTARAVQREGGVPPERVHVIGNGVDVERFRPGPPRPDLVARYGLAGRRTIVTVGRLVARKGIDGAVRALRIVREAVPEATLLVVGDGPERARLEAVAAEEGMKRAVVFAGRVPRADLPDHYRLGEVFLLPNREMPDGDTEGFGLVFLEAGACGLPVIGGRAGGVCEAVDEGRTGLLVDGTSVPEVADAVRSLLGSSEARRSLGEAGRSLAMSRSWARQAERFRSLWFAGGPSPA